MAVGTSVGCPLSGKSVQMLYPDTDKLLLRRQKSLGLNTATHMMNSLPLHVVRGKGCHLYSDQGVELLDCVNNVAHVGHCHPKVATSAMLGQHGKQM